MPKQNYRILVIDDNPQIHEDFRKIFAPKISTKLDKEEQILFGNKSEQTKLDHFQLDFAFQGEEALKLVQQSIKLNKPYAVIFVDIRMPPGWDGIETIGKIWEVDADAQTVICTAYSDYSWEDIYKKFGETDRLLILKKPFDSIEVRQFATTLAKKWLLTKQVKKQLDSLQDTVEKKTQDLTASLTERKKLEEQISYKNTHDILTGLPNRSLLVRCIQKHLKQLEKHKNKKAAILFFDIDKFKLINESLGRKTADNLLKEFAKRLQKYIRPSDIFARDVGDEFVLYINNFSDQDKFIKAIKRIEAIVKKPFIIDNNNLNITASIGISVYPADGTKAEILLNNADLAMHRVKEKGGNGFQFYTTTMNLKAGERLKLGNDLARALEKKELIVYYQPIYDLKNKKIVGAEALIRWQHPKRGFLRPVEFIPIAEETSLIKPIGAWVIKTALDKLKTWHNKGLKHLTMSINLSPNQFKQGEILKVLKKTLDRSGIDPKHICLELTENLMLQDLEETQTILDELKKIGVSLAIDDFGMGYSNLNYISRLPIDKIKIDKFFMRNLLDDENDKAVVLAILKLAKDLNLKVLSEGVDDIKKLKFLEANGCDECQGYLISKPTDAETCEQIFLNAEAYMKSLFKKHAA